MDRLDTWLNAQRGWRLLLVRCAVTAPFGLSAGAAWTLWVTVDPAVPQVSAAVARTALCVAASFLLGPLTLLPRSWRGPDRAGPTRRLLAQLYIADGNLALLLYAQAMPLAWRVHNGWVFYLPPLALLGFCVVMIVWNVRKQRRLRRRRDHGASPNTWA